MVKARALIHSQDAVNTANNSAYDASYNCANGASCALPFVRPALNATWHSLSGDSGRGSSS